MLPPRRRILAAEQPVEPVKERLVVGHGALVVHVVLARPAPEGRPAVRHQRHVVPTMVLYAHGKHQSHEGPTRERVSPEEPGRRGGEDAEAELFPGVGVLGDPAVDGAVAVVEGVDVAVEEPHLQVKSNHID